MKFKIVLDKRHTREDNKYPLNMRIYEGSCSKERSMKIFLSEEDWDSDAQIVRNTCKSHKLYNSKLIQEKADLEQKILFNIDPIPPPKLKTKHSIRKDKIKSTKSKTEKTSKTKNANILDWRLSSI